MILMPDTNVWIKLLNPGATPVKDRFTFTDPGDVRLCSVVKAELYFGAYKSARKEENLTVIENLFKCFCIFFFRRSSGKNLWRLESQAGGPGSHDRAKRPDDSCDSYC